MDWHDTGYVLSVRPHGETSAIVDIFTAERGRHSGLVRGGRSRRLRPVLQCGNKVGATWKARLEDHLGHYTVELDKSYAELVFGEPVKLDALLAVSGLLSLSMPEREAHAKVYRGFGILLQALIDDDTWPAILARFELGLLQELGFGLALDKCAVTGASDNLTHVSPKSGRAVCADEAEPYRDRLLSLPAFLTDSSLDDIPSTDMRAALDLTGHFLDHWILRPHDKQLPDARFRMLDRLAKG